MSVGDELVDVVDVDDRVLRTVTRREMRAASLRHRAVYLLVVSSDGRLLVHQRAATKDVWPSRWDVAAGGVVGHGESYDDAAVRELEEELGIRGPLERLGTGAFEDDDVRVNGHVYLVRSDGPFRFTDGEVVAAERGEVVAAEQVELGDHHLDALLTTRSWCPDSLAIALPLLRAHLRSAP